MSTAQQPAQKHAADIVDVPFRFTSLVGGVVVATPAERKGSKHRTAVCIRVDDSDTAWSIYNTAVVFTQFSEDEKSCRFKTNDGYDLASCRIIRDCDDLPEAIALASKDLWSTAKPHIFN
jgi:hypothetical protein